MRNDRVPGCIATGCCTVQGDHVARVESENHKLKQTVRALRTHNEDLRGKLHKATSRVAELEKVHPRAVSTPCVATSSHCGQGMCE